MFIHVFKSQFIFVELHDIQGKNWQTKLKIKPKSISARAGVVAGAELGNRTTFKL